MPPQHHPEIFLGTHLLSIPFKSFAASRRNSWAGSSPSFLLRAQGQMTGEQGAPEEKAPRKTSKCFTNKARPLQRTCPPSRPWVGALSGYQKASAPTHKGKCKPQTTYLSPQREQWSRMVHDFVVVEGRISSPLHLQGHVANGQGLLSPGPPLEVAFRRARALRPFSLPPSKSSSLEQEKLTLP